MTTFKTKADLYELGSQKSRLWKSITLNDGDILVTGLKDVWAVLIQDPSLWAAGGWAAGSGATAGHVTFQLTGEFTGTVYIFGR